MFNDFILLAHKITCFFSSEYRTKSLFEDPNGDIGVIHYTQQKIFEFDANNSLQGLSERDIICTINIPLVVRAALGSCV